MKDINKVILLGRLGADPVRRETKTGKVVVQFPVATARRIVSSVDAEELDSASDREFVEETQWHRVVTWGKQADACAKYLKKGQAIFVEGSIRTRTFEDKEGLERLSVEVHADTLSFLQPSMSGQKDSQLLTEKVS
jgi:single-strand DNA-binding protein